MRLQCIDDDPQFSVAHSFFQKIKIGKILHEALPIDFLDRFQEGADDPTPKIQTAGPSTPFDWLLGFVFASSCIMCMPICGRLPPPFRQTPTNTSSYRSVRIRIIS